MDPPDPPEPRARRVADLLLANPGQWALIARNSPVLLPWYLPLVNDDRFEMRYVRHRPGALLGPHDVYARAKVPPG